MISFLITLSESYRIFNDLKYSSVNYKKIKLLKRNYLRILVHESLIPNFFAAVVGIFTGLLSQIPSSS